MGDFLRIASIENAFKEDDEDAVDGLLPRSSTFGDAEELLDDDEIPSSNDEDDETERTLEGAYEAFGDDVMLGAFT